VRKASEWFGVGRTEIGHVRPSNQDAFAVLNECGVWIVADGMGGHPGGDIAAKIAVEVGAERARAQVDALRRHPDKVAAIVKELVVTANQRIHDKGQQQPALNGMGTTVVTLAILSAPTPIAYLAHLGDSRAYLYRGEQLTQLTSDHTLVEQLVQQGVIDAAAAKTHPKRHVLTKGLGMGLDMMPEQSSTLLTVNDLLVLCSDGLTKMLDDADIALSLSRAQGNVYRACQNLIDEALGRGGEDNVTVIVCGARGASVAGT